MLKTNKDILGWVHDNLGETIRDLTDNVFAETPYTESLMAGIICRETGFLILRYANQGKSFEEICGLMKGDYGQRPGESKKQYHGYGFVQIDTHSYPQFIRDTPLSDYRAYLHKAIEVLEEKRIFLQKRGYSKNTMNEDLWLRSVVAAYNTGQGNVAKSLDRGLDPDRTTHQGDYSKEVMKFREIYYDNFAPKGE